MNRKSLMAVLVVLALLLSMLPAAVFANSLSVDMEGPIVEGVRTRAAVTAPTLASGNYVNYLDRVASVPGYVRDFYNWLVANSSADGVLADPTKGFHYKGGYYHRVTTISGSVSYPYTNRDEAVKTGSQLAQEAMSKEFDTFTTWAGVAWDVFDREHPEVFWLSGQSSYSYWGRVSLSFKGNVCTVSYEADMVVLLSSSDFDIRDTQYRSAAAVAAGIKTRDAAVKEILADCPKGSVYEQVAYLNDALTARNAYNSAVAAGNPNAAEFSARKCISALVGSTGKAGPVCEGYSRAFQVLCNQLQIPCVLVDGDAVESLQDTLESHMWNYVQIDGGWYAVDVTWNDPYVSSAANKKVSGSECRKWLLLGSDTQVAEGLNFLDSHEVTNQVRPTGLAFINGPVLERNAYDPNASAGFSVSGTVSSVGAGDMTVQLWQNSTLVGTVTVSGSNGAYTFEGVVPGSYQLTFIKADHATFTQELTVNDNAVTQNVKLRQNGDVSGDGRLNVGDVARLYGHIKKSTVITDSYILLCMDMTGDGRINVGDTARLYAKIRAK